MTTQSITSNKFRIIDMKWKEDKNPRHYNLDDLKIIQFVVENLNNKKIEWIKIPCGE